MATSKKTKTPVSHKLKLKGGSTPSQTAKPGRSVPQGPPAKVPKQ